MVLLRGALRIVQHDTDDGEYSAAEGSWKILKSHRLVAVLAIGFVISPYSCEENVWRRTFLGLGTSIFRDLQRYMSVASCLIVKIVRKESKKMHLQETNYFIGRFPAGVKTDDG